MMRIVLVQSDMQTAQPLARFFTQRGDELWQAWELGQAWALVAQVKPQLVLMDLHFASSEWVDFLRRLHRTFPETRVIMTNQYPDLQREILAREQDVRVFLRQPFTERWIEQALRRLDEDAQPVHSRPKSSAAADKGAAQIEALGRSAIRAVRVPVRVKITLPYLLLVLMFALAGAYLVSRVILESVQDRFLNQLIETGRQSTDWLVREEDRLLTTLRLVSNTQGVAAGIQQEDAEALRSLVLPIALNAGEEAVEILDIRGKSVVSLRRAGGDDYSFERGETIFSDWPFVWQVAGGLKDGSGDKFAGIGRAPWGDYLYVSGPVYHPDGNLAGIVLVGKSLPTLVREMHEAILGDVTLYDLSGQSLASTLFIDAEQIPAQEPLLKGALQADGEQAFTRDLTVSTIQYTEILGLWEARQAPQGILGVSLAQAFLIRTSRITQVQIFTLVAAGIFLVLIVGLYLANLITRPLVRLVRASGEVARGNLEIKVDATGNDEVAVLAQSFNYMVAGLQEGSIYRDLLGRTVSPEVREQLRQTFTSGSLKLEGQQAVATVLMTDIRGFTPISEQADPATVFQWLNEYFAQVVPIVAAHGGVVNKFDGDALLAFFGILPRMLSPRQSAAAACQAALEILQAIDKLNILRASRGEPLLVTGVGVNTGVVMAGGLGTSDRLHYTIIGDTVNTAQRIESLTRSVLDSSGVLISQSTFTALGSMQSRYRLVSLGEHVLKGKAEPLAVHQLLAVEALSGEPSL